MNFSAVLFDMDGLIFDTEKKLRECWIAALKIQNIFVIKQYCNKFIGLKFIESLNILKKDYPKINIEKFKADILRIESEARKTKPSYKTGFIDLITQLYHSPIKAALVTSSTYEQVTQNFLDEPYLEYFKVIVTAEDVTRGKPDPEPYLIACRKLEVQPSNALVLEDSYNGVIAGLFSGCRVIMIPDLLKPLSSITIADSLQDISKLVFGNK